MNIAEYNFSGPYELENNDFIDRAAIYVILCYQGSQYVHLYVGETGQLGTRLSTHHKYECWKNNCKETLYVAVLLTPSDQYTPEKRREIEQYLINKLKPIWND